MATAITVIGAGSWGTALAILLARNGHDTYLWGRDSSNLEDMQRDNCNQRYLPQAIFPLSLKIISDFSQAVAKADVLLVAVPSCAFRETLQRAKPHLQSNARVLWATKGLDPDSSQLLHEVAVEVLGDEVLLGVISGPSFATEVAADLPTAVTLAAHDKQFAMVARDYFHSRRFRVYTSDDMVGVGVSGAVKNVMAIVTGICDGMGFGANARSALITRGLAEMTRLGVAMGAAPTTFVGLAGLGDLVLTCTDDQSRNRRFGILLGRGESIAEAEVTIGQVVEGVGNTALVHQLANQYQVEMPITEHAFWVLQGVMTSAQAAQSLLSREPKSESG